MAHVEKLLIWSRWPRCKFTLHGPGRKKILALVPSMTHRTSPMIWTTPCQKLACCSVAKFDALVIVFLSNWTLNPQDEHSQWLSWGFVTCPPITAALWYGTTLLRIHPPSRQAVSLPSAYTHPVASCSLYFVLLFASLQPPLSPSWYSGLVKYLGVDPRALKDLSWEDQQRRGCSCCGLAACFIIMPLPVRSGFTGSKVRNHDYFKNVCVTQCNAAVLQIH